MLFYQLNALKGTTKAATVDFVWLNTLKITKPAFLPSPPPHFPVVLIWESPSWDNVASKLRKLTINWIDLHDTSVRQREMGIEPMASQTLGRYIFIHLSQLTLTVLILAVRLSHMNSVIWPYSPWVLIALWIEYLPIVLEVMGLISDFYCRVIFFLCPNSPFTFNYHFKIHHLYSLITVNKFYQF